MLRNKLDCKPKPITYEPQLHIHVEALGTQMSKQKHIYSKSEIAYRMQNKMLRYHQPQKMQGQAT
jgi:hypothetical protein